MVRLKKRYVLCEIMLPPGQRVRKDITERELYYAVKDSVQMMHGDFGLASVAISLRVKYLNQLTGTVFIQCRRAGHKMLQTSLPFIKKIGKNDAFLKTLYLSGTIRSCQKFLVKHQRRQLVTLLGDTTDPEERRQIQKSIINCDSDNNLYSELEWPSDKRNNDDDEVSDEDSS